MQKLPPGGRLKSAVGARPKISSIAILKTDDFGAILLLALISEVRVLECLE